MVRLIVRPWCTRPKVSPPALAPAQLARLLLQPVGRLTEAERETLEGFLHANPRLAQGDDLTTRFQTFLAQRDVGALEAWLQEAEPLDLPSFQTVARSFRQNDAAITAALTALWSTGQYEGQICRVKLRKRLGYGHATLDLLGQRILRRVTTPGASVQRALP